MKELIKHIWKLSNSFRGSMDMDSYKNFVVTLLALKYFNDIQNSNLFRKDVVVPSEADWNHLISKITLSEINQNKLSSLYAALTSFEKHNEFLDNAFSKLTSESLFDANQDSLIPLIVELSNINLADIEFKEFFDYFLFNFDLSNRRSTRAYSHQNFIYKLLQEFVPDAESTKIYNPFAGLASLALNLPENAVYFGQEMNQTVWAMAKIRLLVHGVNNNVVLKCEDSIENWRDKDVQVYADLMVKEFPHKYDFIVSIPPFGKLNTHSLNSNPTTKKRSSETFVIEKAISSLKKDGKAAFIIPLSVLSIFGQAQELRKELIKKDILEYVISLPAGSFTETHIKTALIVLNNAKEKKGVVGIGNIDTDSIDKETFNELIESPKIVEALEKLNNSEVFSHIKNEEIEFNDFNLIPGRYLIPEKDKIDLSGAVQLDEILDFIRPQKEDTPIGKKIGIKELSDNPDSYHLSHESDLPEISNEKTRLDRIPPKCLLIASRGNKIKPSFYDGKTDAVFYSSTNIYAFEVDENKVLIDYLIPELHKEYVQNQLKMFWVGSVAPTLRKKDFLSIRIFLPSLKEQNEIVKKESQDRFQAKLKELGFEQEIEKLKKERDEDLRSKKHNILQHMGNVKNSVEVLIQFMKNQGGALNANDVISPSRGLTVETRFSRLLESINDSIYYITNITNDVDFEDIEQVNLADIVKNCIEKGKHGDNFKIHFNHDELSFSEGETEPVVEISVKEFAEVYNNILENAIFHGFTDKNSKEYQFFIELFFDSSERKIVLHFSNNGNPFPKGMKERYGIKGEKAGPSGNKGFGSWKIKQFAENWGTQVNIFDQPENEFPVIVELKFNPVENIS